MQLETVHRELVLALKVYRCLTGRKRSFPEGKEHKWQRPHATMRRGRVLQKDNRKQVNSCVRFLGNDTVPGTTLPWIQDLSRSQAKIPTPQP